ncbi:hypothetical protein Hanom_Chr16g01461161 [Helianthus anomalus]
MIGGWILVSHASCGDTPLVDFGGVTHTSYESMLKSLSPRAMSLSTAIPSSSIPPKFVTLLQAIDIQTHSSPSHEHFAEILTSTIATSEPVQLANPETVEEAIPLESHEILDGILSGATTTNV